ncbi:MAG: MFS transporter [Alphaproteobacteria bacterium]|nr:MFS transporter [Alphaproteobacteria bacterium]
MSGMVRWPRAMRMSPSGAKSRAAALFIVRPVPHAWLIDAPDFWRLWLVGLVVFAVRWLEMLAVAVFAYQHTRSPFIVAALTMLRMLPMALFGAVIGALAERVERRTALLLVVLSMALTSLTLAILAWTGTLAVWHLAVAAFCNGIGWTTDNPVRRTMIGDSVGTERMSSAMSIDVGANNASQIVGPTIGGILLASVGIGGVFCVSVACYSLALIAAWRVGYRNPAVSTSAQSIVVRMTEGLALVRRDPRLVATLIVTIISNIFAWPATSMIPVIGHDRLGLGAVGIGVLSSMTGVGAFCGAVAIAFAARQAQFSRIYLSGVFTYLLLVPVFALAPYPLLSGTVLLMTGMANACFSIMQATLVYLAAPAEMRSRVYGVLSVCIGVGMIGFIQIGLLAGLIGASWAAAATGVAGILAMLLTRRWWRPLGAAG